MGDCEGEGVTGNVGDSDGCPGVKEHATSSAPKDNRLAGLRMTPKRYRAAGGSLPDNWDVPSPDFSRVEALTFDCYGTLIDWESGILATLRSVLGEVHPTDDELLESYGQCEATAEAGQWLSYRSILTSSLVSVCREHGVTPTGAQVAQFGGSVASWPAFSDSASALADLRRRFDLGVITNCDDALFAASNEKLGQPFKWVVTAEQLHSYKPERRNFDLTLERMKLPADRIVHVAQSLYHDHVPARALGIRTVWINRRHGRPGLGATPAADARPDWTAIDMAAFAEMALR